MEATEYIDRLNQLSGIVIGAAIDVHKALGPGLFESVYEECLVKELQLRGLQCESQLSFYVNYKGHNTGKAFRIDLLVENELVIELKAVDELTLLNEVQLVTYLKLLDKRLGLLINFNVERLVDGIRRKVYNFGKPVCKSTVNSDIVCVRWANSAQPLQSPDVAKPLQSPNVAQPLRPLQEDYLPSQISQRSASL